MGIRGLKGDKGAYGRPGTPGAPGKSRFDRLIEKTMKKLNSEIYNNIIYFIIRANFI